MAPENDARAQFIHLGVGAVLSWIAAAVALVARQQVVLRTLLIAAASLTASYVMAGMWPLAFVSALPLWWCYRIATHEV